jgi:hypothetical protein
MVGCDFGKCRDAEHCQQGGTCQQVAEAERKTEFYRRAARYVDDQTEVNRRYGGADISASERLEVIAEVAAASRRLSGKDGA